MHEKVKLAEAKYFYSQMSANFDDREKFTYNLSAFLSSARSVLQYALEEAKSKNNWKLWYNKQLTGSPILQFLRDKRNYDIHEKPIHPTMNAMMKIGVDLILSDSVSITVTDDNVNIKGQSSSEPSPSDTKPQSSQENASTTIRWIFSDWGGPEDIMTLCQKCIDSLEKFVKDGLEKGFLTGQ